MASPPGQDTRPEVLTLDGRPAAPGRACGPLARNRPDRPPDDVEGAVLVARRAVPEDVPRILAAAGTLTLGGSLLSHVGLLSREFGRPSVCLRDDLRARLLDDDGRGALLRLDGVVGGGDPVLFEGDVVLVDGDTGRIRVPGGFDRGRAAALRLVRDRLAEFARLPGDDRLGRLLSALADGPAAAAAFVVEAALFYDAVPAGPTRRLLLGALALHGSPALGPDDRGALLRRIEVEARAESERLRRAAADCARPEELDRLRARLDHARAREEGRRADLDAGPSPAGDVWPPTERTIDERHDAIRGDLRHAIVRVSSLADDALRPRLGDLHRLVRRADAAGIADPALSRVRERLRRLLDDLRAGAGESLVVPLDPAASGGDRALVGGKAAGLLAIAPDLPPGVRIPRGFVVTTLAYRLHLLGETGGRLADAVASGVDAASVSRMAKAAVLAAEIPEPIARAVGEAARSLAADRLAVRSSSTLEDGPGTSLAGQHDSWLGVRRSERLLERIRWCWASLWNVRALRTLAAIGREPQDVAQAVLVQEMVETRAAGVLATRDPSGSRDCMLVNAVRGLGEGIAQGVATGDLYWVRPGDGTILDVEPSRETVRVVTDPVGPGTVERPLPAALVGQPCLGPREIARLAELARVLVAAGGGPREIEFGFTEDDTLVVFQDRATVAAVP